MQQLQLNSTLQGGKYIIKKVLGQGGFGITYLAEHDLLGTKVAIKEFFMKDFCTREETTSHVSVVTESGREQVVRFREKFLKVLSSIDSVYQFIWCKYLHLREAKPLFAKVLYGCSYMIHIIVYTKEAVM